MTLDPELDALYHGWIDKLDGCWSADGDVDREDAIVVLRAFWAAAKRSAHLEDARAGCYFCLMFGEPHESETLPGWWHQSNLMPDCDRDGFRCERPEVWDALSLPPGKPSGTTKSTASEQPDGKTR